MAVGIVFRSADDEPRPIVPFTLTSAAECRRLLLTSTKVWSGARPRNVAGRTASVPSLRPGRGKLKDGRLAASAWLISVTPRFCSWSPEHDVDRRGRFQGRTVRDARARYDDLLKGFAVALARGAPAE